MEMLTLLEFERYYTEKNPKAIIYHDENNGYGTPGEPTQSMFYPLRISLKFDSMDISSYPSILYLKNSGGSIRFRGVKKVGLDRESSLLGDIVTLYCHFDEFDMVFTLILQ